MNNNVMCENCAHKDVCKYRDEFTDAQKQFNNFKIFRDEGTKSDVEGSVILMESLPYIEVPMPKCTKFLDKNTICNDALVEELARIRETLPHVVDNDADVYQKNVMRYAPSNVVNGSKLGFIYGVIGLCGEAGEASELVKKFVYHGHTLDYKHLARELGDVLWYVAYMADLFGYSQGKIMAMNQEKLAKRYPDGKFDAERSRNRKEGDI